MRKPVNNETLLINDIWKNKKLDEQVSSRLKPEPMTQPGDETPKPEYSPVKPSIYDPTNGLNWAKLTANSIKKSSKYKNGPTIEIDEKDLDGDTEITVDMTDIFSKARKATTDKKVPEFPHWGESPHGYEPTTDEDVAKATEWRDAHNKQIAQQQPMDAAVAMKRTTNFVDKITKPFGVYKEPSVKGEYSPTPSEQPMDAAVKQKAGERAAAEFINRLSSRFAPRTKREFSRIAQEQPMDAAVGEMKAQEAARKAQIAKDFAPSSPGYYIPPSIVKTPEMTGPSADQVQKDIDTSMTKAEKLAKEEKAATPEQRKTVERSAERLSKETGKTITPYTVTHSKELDASIQRNKKALEAARAKSVQATKPTTSVPPPFEVPPETDSRQTATSRPKVMTTSGRETGIGTGQTAFQPDRTWDEVARENLPAEFKNAQLTRKGGKVYANGIEMTAAGEAIANKYTEDAPTREQLREHNTVSRYANFIAEMARPKKQQPPKEGEHSLFNQPPEPGVKAKKLTPSATPPATPPVTASTPATKPAEPKPEPKKTRSRTTKPAVAKTEETPAVSTPVTPTPVPSAKPIPGSFSRPAHGGRSSSAETTSAPVSSTPVTPKSSTPPLTPGLIKAPNWVWGSGEVPPKMKQAEPLMMSRKKAAGLGAAAGAAAAGLLATIMAITGKGQQKTPEMQPKPVNTENTPIHSEPVKSPQLTAAPLKLTF